METKKLKSKKIKCNVKIENEIENPFPENKQRIFEDIKNDIIKQIMESKI